MNKTITKFLVICMFTFISITQINAADYNVSGSPLPNYNGTYVQQNFDCDGFPVYKKTGTNYVIMHAFGFFWTIGEIMDINNPCNSVNFRFLQPSNDATPPMNGWDFGVTVELAAPSIKYSSTQFVESSRNNGSIANSIIITHNNFSGIGFTGSNGENFVNTGKVSISNVPAGLTASVIRNSSTQVTFTLIGNAVAHTNINDISNLNIAFNNSAFTNNNAPSNTNYSSAIKVNFVQVYNVGAGQTYSTIQSAVNAANNFDIISISAQTFTESGIDVINKNLTFLGQGSNTIIQASATAGSANNRIFKLVNDNYDELNTNSFENITFKNGNYTTSGYPDGGGAIKATNAVLRFKNCSFESNRATTAAPDGYYGNGGGAIQVQFCALDVENCTFYDNKFIANNTGDFMGGGAITFIESYRLNIKNSTFSQNVGEGKGGGAIFAQVASNPVATSGISIINSTFNGNSTPYNGGAYYGSNGNASNVLFKNNIFYGNSANGGGSELFSENSASYNIVNCLIANTNNIGSLQGNFINCIIGQNPLLGSLAFNGGFTKTFAIPANSPAVNAGATGNDVPTTDQRGQATSGIKDIGAFEACISTASTLNVNACNSYTWAAKGNKLYTASNNTDTIKLVNANGCDSIVTLNLNLTTPTFSVSGQASVCVGDFKNYAVNTSGGVWGITGRGTIDNNGAANFTSAGNINITYSKSVSASCVGVATFPITINALPATPNIIGAGGQNPSVGAPAGSWCRNRIFNLAGVPAGGTWSSTGGVTVSNLGGVNSGSTTGAASLSYTVTNASGCNAARTFSFNVVACATKGSSSQPITSNSFTVYPNPAKDVINVKFDRLSAGTIAVTDLYGKQLITQPINFGNNTINVSKFVKGMYIVNIVTENGRETKKVVVE